VGAIYAFFCGAGPGKAGRPSIPSIPYATIAAKWTASAADLLQPWARASGAGLVNGW